jgi:hypothetical protein
MTVATSAISADPMLERITRTIVEQFGPQRIVLFGSRARRDARPDSQQTQGRHVGGRVPQVLGGGPRPDGAEAARTAALRAQRT